MANANQQGQNDPNPTNMLAVVSIVTGIFGWLLAIFILVTSFTPLSRYFPFGRVASYIVLASPGISWAISILTGIMAARQIKGKGSHSGLGPARWGIALSGIGCALLYGFFLLIALGFYILFSKGYIGFVPHLDIVL